MFSISIPPVPQVSPFAYFICRAGIVVVLVQSLLDIVIVALFVSATALLEALKYVPSVLLMLLDGQ